MIENLIRQAMERNKSHRNGQLGAVSPSNVTTTRVPTLKPHVYRSISPQLKARYAMFGRWERATHGIWLSLEDMESLWDGNSSDPLVKRIVSLAGLETDDWPNEASNLFKLDRLSLFAGSDLNYHKVYLLWLDEVTEPEFWVYDSNGESRFTDLQTYLRAYLDDDVSAAGRSWRA